MKEEKLLKDLFINIKALAKEVENSSDLYYKATEEDMSCRGYKYEMNKVFISEDNPELCKNGFHACKKLENVSNYYNFISENCRNKVFIVRLSGKIDCPNGEKSAAEKIEFIRELSIIEQLIILPLSKTYLNYIDSLNRSSKKSVLKKYSVKENNEINSINIDKITSIKTFEEFSNIMKKNQEILNNLLQFKLNDIKDLSLISKLIKSDKISLSILEKIVDKALEIFKISNIDEIMENRSLLLDVLELFYDKEEFNNYILNIIISEVKNKNFEILVKFLLKINKLEKSDLNIYKNIFRIIKEENILSDITSYIKKNNITIDNRVKNTIMDQLSKKEYNMIENNEYLSLFDSLLENTLFDESKLEHDIFYKSFDGNIFYEPYDIKFLTYSDKYILKNIKRVLKSFKNNCNYIVNRLLSYNKINLRDYIDDLTEYIKFDALDRYSIVYILKESNLSNFKKILSNNKRIKLKSIIDDIVYACYYERKGRINNFCEEDEKKLELLIKACYNLEDNKIRILNDIKTIANTSDYVYASKNGKIIQYVADKIYNEYKTSILDEIKNKSEFSIKELLDIFDIENYDEPGKFNDLFVSISDKIISALSEENIFNFILSSSSNKLFNILTNNMLRLCSDKIISENIITDALSMRFKNKERDNGKLFNKLMGKALTDNFNKVNNIRYIFNSKQLDNMNKNILDYFIESVSYSDICVSLFNTKGNKYSLFNKLMMNYGSKNDSYISSNINLIFGNNLSNTDYNTLKQFRIFVENIDIEKLNSQQLSNFVTLYINMIGTTISKLSSKPYNTSEYRDYKNNSIFGNVYSEKMLKVFKNAVMRINKEFPICKNTNKNNLSRGLFKSISYKNDNYSYIYKDNDISSDKFFKKILPFLVDINGKHYNSLNVRILNDHIEFLLEIMIELVKEPKIKINKIAEIFISNFNESFSFKKCCSLNESNKELFKEFLNLVKNSDKTNTKKWYEKVRYLA